MTLLGGAAAVWPSAALPQERVRRVGVLSNPGADDAEMQSRTAAFAQGLRELGWTVGGNLQIEYRWSNGNAERLRSHAAELIALEPDVVLATSGVSVMPLLEASHRVPIVFAQTIDPVGLGVVESLSGLYLGESLGQIGIFVIFILVLLFRPNGLFGERA